MLERGFDEARVDGFGNVLGRIGAGRRALAFDAHVDTVGVGDPALWEVDPFGGELRAGVVYGRGASDQKGGMAALIQAGALLKKLAIGGDMTVWIVGSVLEEDCDGLCWHYLLKEGILRPEVVVLTEPTNLQLYRGHRGRMEIEVTTHGVSCHGSAPERGVNAIYRMAPLLREIERMPERLGRDEFLGPGTVTVSEIRSTSPSLCAVADACAIHLDRRLTSGETDEIALAEIEALARAREAEEPEGWRRAARAEARVPEFRRPSHTGLTYPMRQYYPAWALPESHRFVQLGLRARELALGERGRAGKWAFSTNGVATMGMHGIPTVGFGPGNEIHAHSPADQCPVEHLGRAIAFYLTFAALFAASPVGGDG
jgi:putative selenium metabolism hydrolase